MSDECAIALLPFAQSCDTTGAASEIDEICGNQPGDIPCTFPGVTVCSTYTQVLGPDHIYTFTVGLANQLTFALTTPDDNYDPSIYITSVCGDGATCVTGSDECFARANLGNPCGVNSDEIIGPVVLPVMGAGTYYLYVDSWYAPGNPNGYEAGPYTLDATGQLGVELIEFTVD